MSVRRQPCSVLRAITAGMLLLLRATSGRHAALHSDEPSPTTSTGSADYQVFSLHCIGDDSVACLKEDVVALRKQSAALRKQLGQLACKYEGIGPTGGFCLPERPEDLQDVGGNSIIDEGVADFLAHVFLGKSVLDLGCGVGQYGAFLRRRGIDWLGFDGAENVESATRGLVQPIDLTVPQWLGRKFDYVMSLEVGEHLPHRFEGIFIDNLARHAACGIILSWAVEGQPGHHHVNTRNNDYIILRLSEVGFEFNEHQTRQLREKATVDWFRSTLMAFDLPGSDCN